MSICVQIADAVAGELNNGSFSPPFTAQRRLLPEYEIGELTELKATVVPKAVEISSFSRTMHNFDVQIDIGIQKKLDGEIDDQLPALMGLVEQIADYLRKRPLAGFPNAVWVSAQNVPIYARDHITDRRVFTSILTLTYRVVR